MKKLLIVYVLFMGQLLLAQNHNDWNHELFFNNFFNDIYTQFDKEKLDFYFSEDALIMESGEVFDLHTFGKKIEQMSYQFDEEAKNGYTFIRKNDLEFIKCKKHDELLWITMKNSANFKVGETNIAELNYLVSAFLNFEEGNWKIHMFHMDLIN